MDHIITTKLREDALVLRRLSSESESPRSNIGGVKQKMMREIHLILTLMLGPPPNPHKDFTWDHYDKNDKFHSFKTTPLKFAAELSSSESLRANSGSDVHELFSLVNDPRNKYGELLTVSRLGNVMGMRGITYVNVDMPVRISHSIPILLAILTHYLARPSNLPASPCSVLVFPSSSAVTLASFPTALASWIPTLLTTNSASTFISVFPSLNAS